MRSRRSVATVLIGQPLLDGEVGAREAIGNAYACLPVAVEQVALRLAAFDVRRNRLRDVAAIVADVDHVVPALASQLTRADVDGGHAEIRALADRDAGIADDRGRAAEQAQEGLREHVEDTLEGRRMLLPAEAADAFPRALGAGGAAWP